MSALTTYQRFETTVAFVLTAVIGAVIVIALGRLIVTVVDTLIIRAHNPLEHETFQSVFGEIMTLLIALEFNHTLRPTSSPAKKASCRHVWSCSSRSSRWLEK